MYKKNNHKNWLTHVLIVLSSMVVAAIGTLAAVFRREIQTMQSVKKLDDAPLYTMTYTADYALDDFLKTGAATDGQLVDFIMKKLLKGLPLKLDVPDLGCSTFYAQTPQSDYLFGRNFDLAYAPPLVVHTAPDNGYRSISTVNLSFLGYREDHMPDRFTSRILTLAAPYAPMDGMNEKGLAVAVLLLDKFQMTNQNRGKVNLQTSSAVRMLLDKCATVQEAIAMLEEYDMHSSANNTFHFHLCDAIGVSAIVEYIDDEMVVIYPESTYQACTNFVLAAGPHYGFGNGQQRYHIISTKLEQTQGILTAQEAMALLEDAQSDLSEFPTRWSMVYNLTTKTAEITADRNFGTVYSFSIDTI